MSQTHVILLGGGLFFPGVMPQKRKTDTNWVLSREKIKNEWNFAFTASVRLYNVRQGQEPYIILLWRITS
jgi:hypothetical protein